MRDPLPLARALVRCPSVTPVDAGAIGTLEEALRGLGFRCDRLIFASPGMPEVVNLFARLGDAAPHFCFAGHTDVVPPGQGWSRDPFAGEVAEGELYGRGATDMKGAIACFVAAVARVLQSGPVAGSISLLITGDEEGPAVDGTARVLSWLAERGELPDACLVGEPTNPARLGDAVKIGRRGSLNGRLTVSGTQGHTAYPHLADNPIPRLLRMLQSLLEKPLDQGSEHFQPSTVEITTIDVGNPATNVIPAEVRAGFNIRFNDRHTGAGLEAWLRERFDAVGGPYALAVEVSGEAFLTPPGPFTRTLSDAIAAVTGHPPAFDTSGGTSDARFIKDYCPVAEFGLVGKTMHKADERVAVADLRALAEIYEATLRAFFARAC
ncbi:MAG: succinyl-diaminopimelate desuccinylase [Rhodospirillales bacterium]|nr:succinyl-diaminopimelate desuccinylase [Rhodospirillales bacterium]